ncbi:O-antigen ligase family protein [Aliivibrio fischeri]|uniref:O-antigen ligase family protein n=1 Tax=Aliivibrio fischeri TaxID=668 RepID=UPI001F458546|nr:O-antigen ligase family protein [Aliivibrio fischeri]MCE4935539.1 O-antigen ligase family protein [Aliivibrio fischeri]
MNRQQILKQFIFAFPAIFLFTGFYLTKSSPKILVGITISFILFSIFTLNIKEIITQIKERKFVWLLWIASLFALISKEIHGYGNGEIRVLVCLAVYTSCIPNNTISLLKKNLNLLIISSCVISFIYSFYFTYLLDIRRELWPINPNPYSTFSASVTVISLYYLIKCNDIKYRIMNLIAFSIGFSSIIISQTRGSLLSLFISLIFLFILTSMKKKTLIISLVLSAIFSIGILNAEKFESRFEQTKNEIISIKSGNLNTSMGHRLQIWQAGYELAKSPTLIGLGETYIKANENLFAEGKITKEAVYWDHYHNQYINTFIKHGFIGIIILILFIAAPIWHYKKIKGVNLSLLGVLISIIYIVSSLTEIPFNQAISLGFYLIFSFIITSKDEHI